MFDWITFALGEPAGQMYPQPGRDSSQSLLKGLAGARMEWVDLRIPAVAFPSPIRNAGWFSRVGFVVALPLMPSRLTA